MSKSNRRRHARMRTHDERVSNEFIKWVQRTVKKHLLANDGKLDATKVADALQQVTGAVIDRLTFTNPFFDPKDLRVEQDPEDPTRFIFSW